MNDVKDSTNNKYNISLLASMKARKTLMIFINTKEHNEHFVIALGISNEGAKTSKQNNK